MHFKKSTKYALHWGFRFRANFSCSRPACVCFGRMELQSSPQMCRPWFLMLCTVTGRGQAACRRLWIINITAAYLPSSSYSWYSSVKRVQVVVAMMFPPRTGVRVPSHKCTVCLYLHTGGPRSQVSAHLRPPDGGVLQLQAGTHTHAPGSDVSGLSALPSNEDALFEYHTKQ